MNARMEGTAELRRWTERQVVGACLLDPDFAIRRAAKWIEASDFANPGLRGAFGVMLDLAEAGQDVTLPAVLQAMVSGGRFSMLEHGVATLSEVLDETATATLIEENARALRRFALEQRARVLHAEAIESGLDEDAAGELTAILGQLREIKPGGAG